MTSYNPNQREAILKRLRELLMAKRARFAVFLDILEQQPVAIDAEDPDAIEFYIKLESEVLAEIRAVQTAIVPLRELGVLHGVDSDVDGLESAIERMAVRIRTQHEHNFELLSRYRDSLGERIEQFRLPPRANEVYGHSRESGALLNVAV